MEPTPNPILLTHPALVPVIELETHNFAVVERPSPNVSGDEDPAAWRDWWCAAMRDQGLTLEPIPWPGSWAVAIESLVDIDAIRVIAFRQGYMTNALQTETQDDEPGDEPLPLADRLSTFPGGFALADGARILWHYGCCTNWRDLEGWSALLTVSTEALWLAHATFRSVVAPHSVTIFIRHEYDTQETHCFEIPTDAIHAMIANARALIAQFRVRLAQALAGHVPAELHAELVELLTRD